ncbi:MAG TPA: CRTAC1 family protein [Kofleriaceae bacterium]|nr:CRTAC1 family protein [Kofleriaceae bacterium]
MTRERRIVWAISAVLFALAVPACKGKKARPEEKRSDGATLTANASQVLDELGSLETKRDVTCWTSFRQLDWFIAEKSYSEFGTLAKIAAIKGLVRAVWIKASGAAKGKVITLADLTGAVKLPEVEIPAERRGDLATFANDVGLENFTNYQKTAEHWRVVLSVLQDEIYAGGESPLKPMDQDALRKVADMATTLSLMLLKETGAAAEAAKSETVEGEHVQAAYASLREAHGLENPERPAHRLDAKEVEVELQPLTRRLIEGKITSLNVFNKTTGSITSDLNKVTRVPLTEASTDHFMKLVQSFDHFVTSGIDPMQADNYLSDGSFARTKFARRPYLDELHVQNAVMQLFPHHMMPNGDIVVRFEPNPGPVIGKRREAFEVKLLDHEQNGVRDSAAHWIALKNVFGEKSFAIDPFAAEYLTEVNSMMLTLFVRRAEEIARGLGKNEIDLDVAKRVQDQSMVMVPPVRETASGWTPERVARKKELMAAYGDALFRDVTGPAGLPTRLPQFEGKGLEPLDAHVGPDPSKLQGHTEPPDPSKVTGHTEPALPGHVEPDLKNLQGHFNLQRIMGGGIAVGDVNGDRYPDLFVAGEGLGRLYLNRGRAAPGKFTDASEKWGVPPGLDDSHGSIFFDLEGDGDLDLLVLRSDHPTLLLRQDRGKLTDAAAALKLVPHRGAHVATAFDYDRDGDLDVFIGYYGSHEANMGKERNLPSLDGRNGSPDQLWRQEADGTFTDVAAQAGVADTGWTLAVGTFDHGMDGDLDLVLANDFGPDAFLENKGDGTFADLTTATDTGDRGSGMNVDFGDVNGDGRWDIYVTNIDMFSKRIKVIFPRDESTIKVDESLVRAMQYLSGNKLYVATGDAARPFTHDEGARMEPGDRGWGWDAGFFDYENDGDDDLYLCNGWVEGSYAGNQKNQMFVNDGGFLYLAPPASPEAFPGNSRAAAQVDLDLDGDVDLVVNNFRQAPRVLENVQKRPGRWIRLRLAGGGKNPRAIGAQVSIRAGGRTILRQLVTGRGYLGQADPAIHVGLGAARTVDVTVTWPDGSKTEHKALAANREHALRQKD